MQNYLFMKTSILIVIIIDNHVTQCINRVTKINYASTVSRDARIEIVVSHARQNVEGEIRPHPGIGMSKERSCERAVVKILGVRRHAVERC